MALRGMCWGVCCRYDIHQNLHRGALAVYVGVGLVYVSADNIHQYFIIESLAYGDGVCWLGAKFSCEEKNIKRPWPVVG